jgi:type VI secretion system protein ImpE
LFGEPEPWMAEMIQAVGLHAAGHLEQAAELRTAALERAPATSGTLNGSRFEWLMDGDSRLGPLLEVNLQGGYYWVPFQRVSEIRIEPPADIRDLVWTPAQFTWVNGGEAVGLIPTRYPGSELSEDNSIRMARRTDWQEAGEGGATGLGQRMLVTDEAEFPLLEVRAIRFEPQSA